MMIASILSHSLRDYEDQPWNLGSTLFSNKTRLQKSPFLGTLWSNIATTVACVSRDDVVKSVPKTWVDVDESLPQDIAIENGPVEIVDFPMKNGDFQ